MLMPCESESGVKIKKKNRIYDERKNRSEIWCLFYVSLIITAFYQRFCFARNNPEFNNANTQSH